MVKIKRVSDRILFLSMEKRNTGHPGKRGKRGKQVSYGYHGYVLFLDIFDDRTKAHESRHDGGGH